MKNLNTSSLSFAVLLICLTLFTGASMAQEGQRTRSQAVYVEVLGNGLTYSLNYDTRFSKSLKGLGCRAGASYFADEESRLASFPILINYLFGRDKHYFEVGAGATLLAATSESDASPVGSLESGSAIIGTMSFAYRLEPQNGGVIFRAGITPVFDSSAFLPFWPQVSFGYAF